MVGRWLEMGAMRLFLLVLGIAGALLLGLAFTLSMVNPVFVEGLAKDLIRHQVEKKVHEKIEALDEKFLAHKADQWLKQHSEQVVEAKRLLKEKLPERVARIVVEMRHPDCVCRQNVEDGIRDGLEARITRAEQMQDRLTMLIRSRYMQTATQLTREFRIFTASNALVFALLAVATLVKRGAALQLTALALVLLLSALIMAGL
ncbi:MAG: hypothetical protein JNM52_06295, partial [Betaproteobacteria bacterium]|nr:hypothetical protein [Betaproteobacteria bacterium]